MDSTVESLYVTLMYVVGIGFAPVLLPNSAPVFSDRERLLTGGPQDEWVKNVFGEDVLYQRVRWN
jgi:hypothetical protein